MHYLNREKKKMRKDKHFLFVFSPLLQHFAAKGQINKTNCSKWNKSNEAANKKLVLSTSPFGSPAACKMRCTYTAAQPLAGGGKERADAERENGPRAPKNYYFGLFFEIK